MNEHSFILSEVRHEIKSFLPSRGKKPPASPPVALNVG
jgi:hypothetical protein